MRRVSRLIQPFCLASATLLAGHSFAQAEPNHDNQTELEEIVITSTSYPTLDEESPGAIETLNEDALQARSHENVAQALGSVTGIHANTAGGRGKQSNFFLRGSDSNRILVLIDGFEVTDPSSPGRSLDLALLNLDHARRIEVLKGPQSGLYGSDAMGGVINIVTVDGGSTDFVRGNVTAFSLGGGKASASFKEGTEEAYVTGGYSYEASPGISAARADEGGNEESDAYIASTAHLRTGIRPTSLSRATLSARITRLYSEIDEGGGAGADDDDYAQDQLLANLGVELGWMSHSKEVELVPRVSVTQVERSLRNDRDDADDTQVLHVHYEGLQVNGGLATHLRPNAWSTTTIAYAHESESMAIDDHRGDASDLGKVISETHSALLQQYMRSNLFFVGLNYRFDDHLDAASFHTYRIAPGVEVASGTTIKASYGTGAKTPSLYQLHSAFGNRELDVETSNGYDLGLIQELDRHSFALFFFENRFRNLIDYSFEQNRFENIGRAVARGVELSQRIEILENVELDFGLTLQKTRDEADGQSLLRRPMQFGSIALQFKGARGSLRPSFRYVGERRDVSKELPAHGIASLYGSLQATSSVRLYGSVENIANLRYEEVAGYGTPGRHGVFGLEGTL